MSPLYPKLLRQDHNGLLTLVFLQIFQLLAQYGIYVDLKIFVVSVLIVGSP